MKIVYGAGGLDWGSQKLLIFAKNEFEIVYGAEGLDWGGGKLFIFAICQKRTSLKSFTGGEEIWIGGPKNCLFLTICPHQAIRAPALQSVIKFLKEF